MEGYIQRMLWCLVHEGILSAEAAHDPWGPELDAAEFESIWRVPEADSQRAIKTGRSRGHDSRSPPSSASRCPTFRLNDLPGVETITTGSPGRACPPNLEAYLLDVYALEMTGSYAGLPVRNPWGKASGQLTLNLAAARRGGCRGPGLRRAQDRDRPGCLGPPVHGCLGDEGIADGRRTDHQPADRRPGLDHHLERQGLVAIVRRLPRPGPRRRRSGRIAACRSSLP